MSYYRQGPYRTSGLGAGIGVPPLTPYVKGIMIACAAVWLVELVVPAIVPWFGLVPARVVQGWLWQPLSYMFLHSPSDPFHLVFNMLILWMFGGDLERYWGGR
jgi:membrane associated rhomboid family serine protease